VSGVSVAPAAPSPLGLGRRESLRQLLRSPTFLAGALILGFWILCALLGSRVTPDDPLAQSTEVLAHPGLAHLFGTDQLGRDVLSRVLAGSRSILAIAPAATLLAILAGTSVGLVSGYYGGLVDDLIGRLVDAVLALPLIVLAVTIIAGLGHSTATLVVVVGVLFTPLVSRTVRAAVLAERRLDYVQAARLRGENGLYVMFVEILPNVAGPIVVEATVRLGYAIFTIAGLTFLGFGVQPPSPDWALQISDNYDLLAAGTYWWTVLFPALAIASLVVSVNLVADGIGRVLER
jgi:peptide/nickel transport system permease protein